MAEKARADSESHRVAELLQIQKQQYDAQHHQAQQQQALYAELARLKLQMSQGIAFEQQKQMAFSSSEPSAPPGISINPGGHLIDPVPISPPANQCSSSKSA